jgi:hypothetical protein
MISGLTLSKSTDCAGSAPRSVGARTARRVMTAQAAVTDNGLNAAVQDVDSARVRFSHIGGDHRLHHRAATNRETRV